MKRQSLHVKANAIYDQFTKQQVIWTHGYGATDRYVIRNEWGALLLQWPVQSLAAQLGQLALYGHRSRQDWAEKVTENANFMYYPAPHWGGGYFEPPLSFSCDIFQTNAGIVTKLAIPSLPTILHIVWKF